MEAPNASTPPLVTPDDVKVAADRIANFVLRTPVIPNESFSRSLGCSVLFKAENLQHGGAFKARGATNAVMALNAADAARGVVTHSSGNHATALARAASIRGIDAHLVMPRNAPLVKIESVRSYGITPVFCDPTVPAREAACAELQQKTGATLVHPYESPDVIAGQGTVGLELIDQIESLDAILVPVGGGGLLAGILTVVKAARPSVTVVGVEPAWADDTARSMRIGERQPPLRYDSVADGLRTQIGRNTFPIIQHLVDDILLVDEQSICSATRHIAETAHLVAEPSGAVAFAGLRRESKRFKGRNVAVIVSGGNLTMDRCSLGISENGSGDGIEKSR